MYEKIMNTKACSCCRQEIKETFDWSLMPIDTVIEIELADGSISLRCLAGTVEHGEKPLFFANGRTSWTAQDGDAIPLSVPYLWDGRNELGELVPVGTYVVHLEVVDNKTAKRQERVAPIVVGTLLSR